MMNKNSSRLIAWLLTLVMILNLSPISALASGQETVFPDNDVESPKLEAAVEYLSLTPGDGQYVVRYMVRGDYSYDNIPFKFADDAIGRKTLSDIERDPNNTFNEEKNNGKFCQEAKKYGDWANNYDYDPEHHVLTLYFVPKIRIYYKYFCLNQNKNGIEKKDFQNDLMNGEANLLTSPNETIKVSDFLINSLGISYNQNEGAKVENGKIPKDYVILDGTVWSYRKNENNQDAKFKEYTIKYLGYSNQELQSKDQITLTSSVIDWKTETNNGNIYLYYWFDATENEYKEQTPPVKKHAVTYSYTGEVPQGAPFAPATAEYEEGAEVQIAQDPELTGYTFSGWKINGNDAENFNMGSSDVQINGSWSPKTYTVIWKNGDTVLETDTEVIYGSMPSYDGAEPEKEPDVEYTYGFNGWEPKVDTVTDNVTYYAQFAPTAIDYTVVLTAVSDSKTYDGTKLENSGVTATGLPEGYTVEATASGEQTNAGSSSNVVNDGYVIKNDAGTDRTDFFTNVTKANGTLTVRPAPVTITTGSDSKAYDGTALTNTEVSITGLVNNETATVTATGSQTEVGSGSNTYSIDWGKTDKDNYTITENLGTLTVNENNAAITLTAVSDSKTYDGTKLENLGVTATGLPQGFTVEATASGKQTNAGSSNNVVNDGYVIKNAAGEVKTANFKNVQKVDGTLTVKPAPVTITTGSDSKAYDGTALTNTEVSITGLVNNETATVTATGSQTEVGSGSNTYSIEWGKTDKDNYTITENLGTLTVNENSAAVTLTAVSDSKTYDGTKLQNSGVTATGLPQGFTVEASASGEQTNAGSSNNVVNDGYVIRNAAGEVKTANFTNIVKVNGTLTVNPAPVTITVVNASKTYGDDDPGFSGKVEGLVNGNDLGIISYSRTNNAENAGTYEDVLTAAYTNNNNYRVTVVPGDFEIARAKVTVKADDKTATYGQTIPALTAGVEGLKRGDAASVISYTVTREEGTDAGTYTITPSGNAVQSNYDVTFETGTLTIGQAKAKVTPVANGKTYGETDPALTATVTGTVGSDVLSYTVKREAGENVGTYKITVELGSNPNYDVSTDESLFTVKPKNATVTADNKSKTYGEADPALTATVDGLINGDTLAYSLGRAQGEDIGSYAITPSGDAAQGNYTVTYNPGTLTIGRATLTVTVTGVKKVYGEADPNYQAQVEGLVGSDDAGTINYGFTRDDGEDVGNYTVTLIGDKDQGNYSVNFVDGILTIEQAQLTVKAADQSKVYGAAEPDLTAQVTGLKGTDTESLISWNVARTEGENAGTYSITASGEASQGNYTVTFLPGTMTIGKRAMTLTSGSSTREYNGSPLTNGEVTGADFINGEGATYSVTGSQTLVGSSPNTFAYTLNAGTKADNYDITLVPGMLNVTNRNAKYEITVKGNSGSYTFDGNPKTVSGMETLTFAVDYNTYTVEGLSAAAEGTNAGTYDVNVTGTAVVKDRNGNDVTEQFAVKTEAGALVINPAAVTVTAKAAEKTYGDADPEFKAEVTGTIGNDTVEYSLAREEGTDAGNYTITPSGSARQGNYAVTFGTATLTVKQAPVTVTAENKSKVYGDSDPTLTASVEGMKNGEDPETVLKYALSRAEGETVGGYAITAAGEKNQGNYEVTFAPGTLTVTQATATVKAAGKSKVYGDADPALTGTVTGLKNGDSESVIAYTLSRATGEDVGEYAITPAGNESQGNYKVVYEGAKLAITKATATVKAIDNGKTYGESDPDLTAEVTGLKNGNTESVITYTLGRAAGENAGTYAITPAGAAEQGNYNVVYTTGTMTISAKTATITVNGNTKEYGEADPAFTGTVEGLVKDGDLGQITYSRTNAVEGNVGTYEKVLTANYTENTNYAVTVVPGDFVITQAPVTVKAIDRNKTYGEPDPGLTVTITGIKGSDTENLISWSIARATGEDAGTYSITASGEADQHNYSVTFLPGTMTIGKRAMTLTSGSGEKEYDGSPLTNDEVTGEDFITGEGATYTVTGSQTLVGSTKNTFSYTLNEGTKAGNYEITMVEGNLNVKTREAKYQITVQGNSDSYTYDGNSKTVDGVKTLTFALDNDTYTVSGLTATAEGTDAGTYGVSVNGTAVVRDSKGNDVSDQFAVSMQPGTMTINAKPVTITVNKADKVYGDPDPGFTGTVDGLVNEGDLGEIVYSRNNYANDVNVGTYSNVLTAGYTANKNYAVTVIPANFEITQATVTVTAANKSKEYGDNDPELTASVTDLKNGDAASVISFTLSRKDGNNAGSYIVTPAGEEEQGNYKVNFVTGALTISKAALTVTLDTKTKTYGDKDPDLTAKITGLKNGDTESVISFTLSRAAGENVNKYNIEATGSTELDNYTVKYVPAEFEIQQRVVTVTADNKTRTNRTGEKEPDLTVTIDNLVQGDDPSVIKYEIGRAESLEVKDHDIVVTGKEDQGNYRVLFKNGIMKVTDGTDPLYNIAEVKLKGKSIGFYKLARQDNGILATKPLEDFLVGVDKGKESSLLQSGTDYTWIAGYDFTNMEFTLNNKTYVYRDESDQETPLDFTKNYFTVDFSSDNVKVVAANQRIGGDKGWLVPEYDIPAGTSGFKRTFTITLRDIETADLYNFLKIGDSYYRLKRQPGIITAVTSQDYRRGFPITLGQKIPEAFYKIDDNGYDFTNVVFEYNNKEYHYIDHEPTEEENATVNYFTADFDRVLYKKTIHSKAVQINDEFRWLDGSKATYLEPTNNNNVEGFHRDYLSTLYDAKYTPVTLVANSDTNAEYDGNEHTVTGYKVMEGSKELTNITFSGVTVSRTETEAGEYTVGFDEGVVGTRADNNQKYYVSKVETGTLKIAPVTITIKADNQKKVYDNNEDTDPALTATVTGVPDKGVEPVYSLSRTVGQNVADYAITVTAEQVSNPNYTVKVENGTFTITTKSVTLTAKSDSFTYDGNAHSNDGYDVTGLVGTDTISAKVTGTITFPRESPVENKVDSYEFTVGTPGNYSVTPVNGELTMVNAAQAITITAASQTWTYDGNKYENKAVTVTDGTLLTGDELVAEATGSVTNVEDTAEGNNPIAAGYKVMHGTEEVTGNYTITLVNGKLAITPKSVTLTAKSESFTYDGNAHTNNGYDVVGLVGSDTISAKVTGTITFPSESPVENKVDSYEFTVGTPGNYSVTPVDGELTMVNAEQAITITAASQTWTYDGDKHSNAAVTITEGELLPGDELVAEATGEVTNVADTAEGNNTVAAGYKVMHGEEDVTASYVITPIAGKLAITPKSVTLTAKSESFTYDGNAHTNNGYDVVGLVGSDTISAKVTGTITFPSESPVENKVDSYEFTVGTPGNYSVTTENGALTMVNAAQAITITAASETWTYDGDKHSNTAVTLTEGELLTGDRLVATANGEATNVSDTAEGNNPIASYAIMNGEEDVTESYVITPVDGKLAITPKSVTLTAKSERFTYDGNAHTNDGYDVTGLVGTNTINAKVTGTITFTSESPVVNKVDSYEFTVGTPGNYSVTTADGELTMVDAEQAITITAASQTWTYDGAKHSNAAVTITEGELLPGDELVAEATGEVTNVADTAEGNNPVAAGYKVMHGEEDVTASYLITTVPGTLAIEKKAITLTIEPKGKTYGDEDPELTAHFGEGDLEGEDTVEYKLSRDEGENAGTYAIHADVTSGNYEITVVPAELTIGKKTITLTIDPKSKVYGEEDPELTAGFGEGDLVGDDTIEYTLTRDEGEDAGDYEIHADITSGNYDIIVVPAELTVEKVPQVVVRITAHSGEYLYDAAAHTVEGYDVTEIDNELYTVNDFIFSGNAKVTAANAGSYAMNLRPSSFTNINDNFANVTFEITDGSLVIDPKPVTITAEDRTKVYGEDDPTLGVTVTGLAGSDYIVANAVRAAGEDVGTYAIGVQAEANPNYTITTVDGTLTITPKAVTVTAADKSKVFGTADPALTATVSGLARDDSADLIRYTLSRWSGESVGDYVITATGEAAQGNYTVTYVPATLTIVPEDTVVVTITGNSGTFLYDGTEKDQSGYTAVSSNPLYTEADFTFSGNSDLKGTNAGTYRTAMAAGNFTNTNENFENVVFVVENGAMTIARRGVVLTSGNAEKEYDGTALTNNTVNITGDGFAEGEGAVMTVTGRITRVGEAQNTFTYALTDGTLADNYSITTVFGTLRVTETVTHTLTVIYVDEQGDVISTYTRDYAEGEAYSVQSGRLEGFEADRKVVAGTMGGEDITVTVTYHPITYTLLVTFENLINGSEVSAPVTYQLTAGETYAVTVPETPGYTAVTNVITGIMPANDRQITVFMTPDGANVKPQIAVDIEDYGTPLGVADSILGGGEIVE